MAAEVRTEQPKPEAKEPVVTVVEENPEPPLKYKTLLLKVSVHCEGCKRKVIKILKNIEGVYKVEIDLRQQKVTVIGNVDLETLISKLLKAGKHAEVWPDKADNKEKKKGKSKNKDKDKDKENKEDQSEQESEGEGAEKEKETTKSTETVIIQDPSKICETGNAVKQSVSSPADFHSPVAEKKAGNESAGGGDKTTGGGSGGKKKKKKKNKGHNGNNNNNNNAEGGEHSNDAPAGTGSVSQLYAPLGQGPMMSEANHSPPRHPMYQYPAHYYAPPPTVYAVNYNTANPSNSYGASVYAPPSYSYAYMHPGTMSEPQPSDLESYSSEPSGSFEIFSDENPNACSVM